MPASVSLLLLLFSALVLSRSSSLRLCEPVNETISAEKEECPKCLLIQTSICSGSCPTKDPVFKSALSTVQQHVCTYKDLRFVTVTLPDCPPGVDPHFTFPLALSCECSLCRMESSDCTIQSVGPSDCMSGELAIQNY
ncbi:gonadotropin subunit beta-like [Huso huso]|uniref:LH beta subunit n=2 Tax=Acipenseridae TaxID=7900 RepID=Q7T185_ACIGU|nr:LH beta subunit [Acipenser gueldenstaedtii]